MAKIFVAIPVFNFQDPKIKDNQQNFLTNTKHEVVYSQVVGASVEHARSILIDRFLQTDCNYYFTMDADVILMDNIDALDRLIQDDKDIVGGIYFYKKVPCLPVYRPLDLQKIYEETGSFPETYNFIISGGLFEVCWMGNGFKMVKRKVIEEIRKVIKVPNLPMIYKDEYVSEDWAFDQRARELGFTVWADPTIKLGHVGTYAFAIEDFRRYNGKFTN